ncbi:hypothetical protein PNV01_13415 [Turicibacter sanguinis]|uniref:hypothetical protein n=1 Tax=Turicibacter sanguinis TaxID=154288 RepID=UPI00232C3154|nr:hypothetical protein [Turicibacter sanguinis]MDB8545802.1 hypothetical protein [Turicibacter sanguinis]
MGITTRDLQVIRYLEKGFLLNAEICSRLIYWTKNEAASLNVAQRRLRELYKLKQVKRVREYVGQSYTYYIDKAPTKTKHRLMMSDFLSRLEMNGFHVELDQTFVEWKGLESRFGIRPDLLVTFTYANKTYQLLVEIDLTKEYSNGEKYSRIYQAKIDRTIDNILPYTLGFVSICDKKPQVEGVKPLWIKTDFSNFSNLIYAISGV